MLILVVRTLILYGMVIAAMRIMGKRQLWGVAAVGACCRYNDFRFGVCAYAGYRYTAFDGDYSCADFDCCRSYDVIFEP